ncbi:MAG: permease [Alphaproteobacteria bacterium]
MPERRRVHPILNGQVALFGTLALAGGIATWWLRGPDVFLDTLLGSGELLVMIIPIVVAAMLIGGYAQSLVPQDRVARWLGAKSGIRGILLAAGAGAITPGGPFASFALVVALARSGADIGACVTYLTAWSVLGLHRLVQWELPLLGPDLAILRLVVSIPLPIIAGIAARALVRWLSPWTPGRDI